MWLGVRSSLVETQLQDVTDYTDHNKLGATSYTFSLCTELSKPVNREGGGALQRLANMQAAGLSQCNVPRWQCYEIYPRGVSVMLVQESLTWGLDIRWGFWRNALRSSLISSLPTKLYNIGPLKLAVWTCFPVSPEDHCKSISGIRLGSAPSLTTDTLPVWLCLNVNKPLSFDIKLLTQAKIV